MSSSGPGSRHEHCYNLFVNDSGRREDWTFNHWYLKIIILYIVLNIIYYNHCIGRMCTFSVFDKFQRAQLICDDTTCRFSDCTTPGFRTDRISTTCHFNSCTENISDQLLHCQQVLRLCSTHSIQQVCVDVLKNNHSILREICPHPRISHPVSSEMCTGSLLINSHTHTTISASTTSTSSNIIINDSEVGQPGESLIVKSLGALVGILLILLAVVTTGWVCTCWTMRQRERNKTNSEQVRYTISQVCTSC